MALLALGEVTYPFFAPRLTLMGLGCSKEAGAQAKALGAAHVLLVTDKVLNKLGMVQQIRFGLESAGLKVTVFDGVEPNPTDKNASGVTLKPATHGRLKTGHALIPDRCCFTPPM
jgi:alcohol dehydrogenase